MKKFLVILFLVQQSVMAAMYDCTVTGGKAQSPGQYIGKMEINTLNSGIKKVEIIKNKYYAYCVAARPPNGGRILSCFFVTEDKGNFIQHNYAAISDESEVMYLGHILEDKSNYWVSCQRI